MNSESEEAEFNFPSLSFPGFLAEDISSARLGDWYAILLILVFNIGDLIGKAGAHHLPPWSSNTVRARGTGESSFVDQREPPARVRSPPAILLDLGFDDHNYTFPMCGPYLRARRCWRWRSVASGFAAR